MKQAAFDRDEEIVSIVVLAVILFGIVIGSALYTQAQLDAAADVAVAPDVAQWPDIGTTAEADPPPTSFGVRTASQETKPEGRTPLR